MTELTLDRLDGWGLRLERAVQYLPYLSLAVATALAVGSDPVAAPWSLGLAALTACWMLWMVTLHPRWRSRRRLMAGYFTGLFGLTVLLILVNPAFGYFCLAGYVHAMYALRGRWLAASVVATAGLAALSQVGGFATLTSGGGVAAVLVASVFNVGVAGGMLLLSWIGEEQLKRRKQIIGELNEANRRLETALAENAGLHAQLLTQAREAGVLDERARMAREIHDTIAQGLIGIITQLEAAGGPAGHPAGEQPDRRRHLDSAMALARQSLAEARRSVRALQPVQLEDATLPDALTEVARHWSGLHGLAAEVTTTGTVRPMHPEIEGTLLRTAQEALANIAKHAKASRVGLTLSYMEDQVTLDVRDDGVGFQPHDPAAAGPSGPRSGGDGFGLHAMRQRLQRIAGRLEIESEIGCGTAVSASVPAVPARSAA